MAKNNSDEPRTLEIRKYQNRRYYDRARSRHVSLQQIHKLIIEGYNIRWTTMIAPILIAAPGYFGGNYSWGVDDGCRRGSMQWTLRGAHLLLQTRTRVLNEDLDDLFRRWYPKFRSQPQTQEPERKAV